MANTRTVHATLGSGDHQTVSDALAWVVANHDFDTDGIATILIIDSSSYTQSTTLQLNGLVGTTTSTAYLEIKSNSADPFAGPVINCTHSSNGAYQVEHDYTYIHVLEMQLNNTSSSTECIRIIDGVTKALISRCNFVALQQTSDQDGIYMGSVTSDVSIDNCVFVGFARAGCHPQCDANTPEVQTWNIDHCSFADTHAAGEADGGGISVYRLRANPTYNLNVYNCLGYNYGGNTSSDIFNEWSSSSTVNWAGSHNVADDTSAEAKFTSSHDSVTFTETSPASGENAWLTEINSATETDIDLSIAGENAFTVLDGTDRTGSEPDVRQNFGLDILGYGRGATPDIGAFEFSSGGTPVTEILTGVAGTGSVGTVSVTAQQQVTQALTGVEGAGSAGDPLVTAQQQIIEVLTGVEGVGAAGDPTVLAQQQILEILAGVEGAGAAGDPTVTAQQQVTEVLAGVEGVGTAGDPLVVVAGGTTVELTGVEGTGAAGTLAVSLPVSVALSGAEGVGAAGDPVASLPVSLALAGVEGVGSAGTLAVALSTTATLTGVEGVGAAGDIIASIPASVTLTGAEGAGSAGDPLVVTGIAVTLDGAAGTGAAGDLTISTVQNIVVVLPGVSATGEVGTLAVTTTSGSVWTDETGATTIWTEITPENTTWSED